MSLPFVVFIHCRLRVAEQALLGGIPVRFRIVMEDINLLNFYAYVVQHTGA